MSHLTENLKAVSAGPLKTEVVEAFEQGWSLTKANARVTSVEINIPVLK